MKRILLGQERTHRHFIWVAAQLERAFLFCWQSVCKENSIQYLAKLRPTLSIPKVRFRRCEFSMMRQDILHALSLILAILISALCFNATVSLNNSFASDRTSPGKNQKVLRLEIGNGLVVPNVRNAESVFVSDPEVADVKISPEETIFLYGKSTGTTQLIATGPDGAKLFTYKVVVIHQISDINSMLKRRFPKENIHVNSSKGSILISGVVSNRKAQSDILKSLKAAVGDITIVDQTFTTNSEIVEINVKLLSVNHNLVQRHGISWSAIVQANGLSIDAQSNGELTFGYQNLNPLTNLNPSVDISATIDLLVNKNIATLLNETTLSTISEKTAQFEVGGEIPIPTFTTDENNRDFSIDYKFVGVFLEFTPKLLANNTINMKINSSVTNTQDSTLSINGNSFPVLNTHRLSTDIKLRSNQPLLIAGLTERDSTGIKVTPKDSKFSKLIDKLFSRTTETQNNRELIIIITPKHIKEKKNSIKRNFGKTKSNIEYIIDKSIGSKNSRLNINAGFIY